MKTLAGVSLLVLLAFQVFLKAGIVGYYGINRDYITATFCENVSSPQMNCQGKCYLKKQLDRADEAGQHPYSPQKDNIEVQPYIHFSDESMEPTHSLMLAFHNRLQFRSSQVLNSIFHPPTV